MAVLKRSDSMSSPTLRMGTAPVRRLDEVRAARQPVLRYDAAKFEKLRSESHGHARELPTPTT